MADDFMGLGDPTIQEQILAELQEQTKGLRAIYQILQDQTALLAAMQPSEPSRVTPAEQDHEASGRPAHGSRSGGGTQAYSGSRVQSGRSSVGTGGRGGAAASARRGSAGPSRELEIWQEGRDWFIDCDQHGEMKAKVFENDDGTTSIKCSGTYTRRDGGKGYCNRVKLIDS